MSDLYDKCEMLLADMATSLTSHHTQEWRKLLPYLLEHVDTLVTKEGFPAFYAHFCMLDNQLTNAVKRPEDKYLSGQCVQCGRELFAPKRARELECPRCHTLNDLTTTRADLDVQRQLLAERYLFTGPLDQVTTVYNMFNCSDLSSRQVLALLESGVIRGVKTGKNMCFVDTRSLARA
ncbi:hypothetical protein [Alloscardovia macacae]|nr:hypothetical protein [Alloscardovia macacae]